MNYYIIDWFKRSSIEEVSVLLDCLVIAKQNKLLSLESGREHLVNQFDEKSGENMFDKAFNIALKKRVIVLTIILIV